MSVDLIWQKYWRHDEGEVKHQDGFSFKDDPDWVYFEIDPETHNEPLSDEDPRRVHVDNLFEDFESAKEEAIEFMNGRIYLYQLQLAKLHKA